MVKKTTKKPARNPAKLSSARAPKIKAVAEPEIVPAKEALPEVKPDFRRSYLAVGLFALALLLVFLFKNGYLVAAMVDGAPIFSFTLNRELRSRFGEQTLEGIITERLIDRAAVSAGVNVTAEDVAARENEMLKNIGEDISLDELLKYQGITKADFDKQVRMQLSVEKILGKDVTVTEAEIDQYIASYSARMEATSEAALREEARKSLFDERVSGSINSWFSELKEKANIIRFL